MTSNAPPKTAKSMQSLLEQVLDSESIIVDSELTAACEVDGMQPAAVVHPADPDEVGKVLQCCSQEKWSVIPWGGGTRISIGNVPSSYHLALDLSRLDKVVDYDPDNLTLIIGAGCTLKMVEEILAPRRQFFPLDLPFPQRTTVGGALAANAFGPSRLRYGGARDLILGLQVSFADGNIVDLGGKTVKNVAGYDLTKLFIGSYGSLGVITRATLRLLPLPAHSRTLMVGFTSLEHAFGLVARIIGSHLLPTHLDLVQGVPFSDRTSVILSLIVGLDGSEETVTRQADEIRSLARAGSAATVDLLDPGPANSIAGKVRSFASGSRAPLVIRAGLPISQVESFWCQAERLGQLHNAQCSLLSRVGLGIVYFTAEAANDQLVDMLNTLRTSAEEQGGYAIAERLPLEVKSEVDVWGSRREDWKLMSTLKAQFDPNSIMSPGRFLGRL